MNPPDETAILTAFRAQLIADATLMGMIWGIWPDKIPARVRRGGVDVEIDLTEKPGFEYGFQSGVRDTTYRVRGENDLIRLMAYSRSPAAGVVDSGPVRAALQRARTVLSLNRPSGAGIWAFSWEAKIPVTAPENAQGIASPQGGDLYRIRAVGS